MKAEQNPAPDDTEKSPSPMAKAELILLVLACILMPLLGFPVFALHVLPFSLQDLGLGTWLCTFLFLRLKGLGCFREPSHPDSLATQLLWGSGFSLCLLGLSLLAAFAGSLLWPGSVAIPPRGIESAPAAMVILNLLVWAVWEELVYRVLLPGAIKFWGAGVFLQGVVSTLIFAFFHAGNGIIPVLQALVCGALLFVLWKKTRSLALIVTAHGGYNLIFWLLGSQKIFN